MAKSYTADDITVLEGLEPVRKRPAMYIGGVGKDGFHHLLAEILDNSIDEAMNGHASAVHVILSADRRTITVKDDGRGIPVGMHPKAKLPAVTVILTTLHAGGKFGDKNYAHSGGLHGVGASVVNALSEHLEVAVTRDGNVHKQSFVRGKPKGPLKKAGKGKKTGTEISFTPDPKIFGSKLRFDPERIRRDLDDRSFVHKGVKLLFTDEETGTEEKFHQREGLAALLKRAMGLQKVTERIPSSFALEVGGGEDDAVQRLEVVLTWTDARDDRIRSYVNGVHTPSGGTHVNGLKAAVVRAVKAYVETHKKAVPGNLKLTSEDIREGLMGIVSLFMKEPQFQGQTKARLNNPEATAGVESAVWPALEAWLNTNTSIAEALMVRIVLAARARLQRKAVDAAVRGKGKSHKKGNLPDKLADCSSKNPENSELFIVEGDSAGGSAKQGRNSKTQAVLPLRGKVLNAEQASPKKVMATRELADIIKALGCGWGDEIDLAKLNYHKVILLMDADADGDHITTLLLTFFYRYMPQLISAGYLYVAQPPLFKVELGKQIHWCVNEAERDKVLKKAKSNAKPTVTRFKGLGEMLPKTLKETTLDPKTRTLRQVSIANMFDADKAIRELMGKDSAPRFEFIMARAADLDAEEVDV